MFGKMNTRAEIRPVDITKDASVCIRFFWESIEDSGSSSSHENGEEAFLTRLSQLIIADSTSCVMATVDGQPVGDLILERFHSDPSIGWLRRIFVDRAFRGSGVADCLHAYACSWFALRGLARARLYCYAPELNPRAWGFYLRHGWSQVGFGKEGPHIRLLERQIEKEPNQPPQPTRKTGG
ncbi:MAG: GNAT family N-acetyltransferase [Dechloromonas sp.]|nr:MAG: GNAT family N-acetyltransferase [Dechloromonas sp.]